MLLNIAPKLIAALQAQKPVRQHKPAMAVTRHDLPKVRPQTRSVMRLLNLDTKIPKGQILYMFNIQMLLEIAATRLLDPTNLTDILLLRLEQPPQISEKQHMF